MSGDIPILYHYCSVDAFMKIIESKTLWLSDLSHANDYFELMWGIKKLLERCQRKYSYNIDVSDLKKLYNKHSYYAICFSEKSDLLSQWRGYANDGKGVSIGFNLNNMKVMKKYPHPGQHLLESIGCEKMIYKNNEQNNIIDLFIEDIHKKLRNIEDSPPMPPEILWPLLVQNFADYIPFFKNHSFTEENEWRLVFRDFYMPVFVELNKTTEIYKPLGNIKYYSKNDNITNYVEYSFQEYIKSNVIVEINLGPKCKLEKEFTEYFLSNNGYNAKKINVKASSASYR